MLPCKTRIKQKHFRLRFIPGSQNRYETMPVMMEHEKRMLSCKTGIKWKNFHFRFIPESQNRYETVPVIVEHEKRSTVAMLNRNQVKKLPSQIYSWVPRWIRNHACYGGAWQLSNVAVQNRNQVKKLPSQIYSWVPKSIWNRACYGGAWKAMLPCKTGTK